jgi:hypothetical protein
VRARSLESMSRTPPFAQLILDSSGPGVEVGGAEIGEALVGLFLVSVFYSPLVC